MAYKIGYPTCEPPIIWDNYITHMFLTCFYGNILSYIWRVYIYIYDPF